MGNSSSNVRPEQSSKKAKPISLYAEIVTDKALPTDIPPIKVLIHDQIVSTATDSIRDSESVVNQLSKTLIVDFLHNPASPEKFGTLLRYVFGYEYLVQPSRDLVYWSLHNEYTIDYINKSCKAGTIQWIYSNSGPLISTSFRTWLQGYGYSAISEIVRWNLQQDDTTIVPLTEIATQSLPYAKENTYLSMKETVVETLSSDDMKNYARAHIVGYLNKVAGETK